MSKKFRLLMVLVLVTGLFGGLLTGSTVSADPEPGIHIQIPRIDLGDPYGTSPTVPWDTKIQVQNVGTAPTLATATFWGGWSNKCDPNAPGAIGTAQMTIPVGGVWTLHSSIPAAAESAIVTAAEPLAVTVDRWGGDPITDVTISSTYTGIAESMHGEPSPTGAYRYFAPYIMHDYNGYLDTVLTIQNSGDDCTSVWIWYKEQGNCEYQVTQHIENLEEGEAIRVGPPSWAGVPGVDVGFPIGSPWLGSAFISANQPLGIMVDQLTLIGTGPHGPAGTLLSYRGMPYKPEGYDPESPDSAWDKVWYADLLYREVSGWQSSIQVQNLTQESKPTFVCVDFMDQSGDEILFVCDWICRNDANTFYLPAITDLGINHPFGYTGAAEIFSYQQVDYPGIHHKYGEPIFAVVDIKKVKTWDPAINKWRPTVAGETQGGAYNAHPLGEKLWAWNWFMPFIAREGEGVTSKIAVRNNANCNKITGKIWIRDETGTTVGVIHVPWLHPKHLKVFDLLNFGSGWLPPGFVGAAEFRVGQWGDVDWDYDAGVEQLCDVDNDGHVDNEPIMPSVVVMNYGWERELDIAPPISVEGDLARVYEGIPVQGDPKACVGDILGKVHSIDPCEDPAIDASEPIEGVSVSITDMYTVTTNSTGDYEMEDVASGTDLPVEFAADDFLTYTEPITLTCGEDEVLDAELLCLGEVGFKVMSFVTDTEASIIAGASVEYSKPYPAKADRYGDYYRTDGETDNTGVLTLTVPILNATGTFTVSAPSIAETGVFTWTQMVNDPVDCGGIDAGLLTGLSIFGGNSLNSRVYSDTTASQTGYWYGFSDYSCANIGACSNILNNQDVELLLCRFGAVAGDVKVGGVHAAGRLVEVFQDGEKVGEDTTGPNGAYIIDHIPTRCFSTEGCETYSVRVEGVPKESGTWDDCGDVDKKDIHFP